MVSGQRRFAVSLRVVATVLALSVGFASGPASAGLDEQAAAWAADDARTLGRAAPRLVESAIAVPFDAIGDRVAAYADWVYGWLTSLLTAWDLAYVGAIEAGTEIAEGQAPDPGILRYRLEEVVQRRFEETVITPERTNRALVGAWSRSMSRLAAFDARLAAERRVRIRQMAAWTDADPAPALRHHGAPLLAPPIGSSAPPPDLAHTALDGIGTGAGGTADRVLVRSLRPLATRAISVTSRLLLVPVAGGLLTSPALGANGLASAAAGLVALSAGVWGVDYALNQADTALTRPAFEADLRRRVKEAHAEASRLAREHVRGVTCAALAEAVRPAVAGCGPQPGGQPGVQPGVAAAGRSG